jgi:hypothetical protein
MRHRIAHFLFVTALGTGAMIAGIVLALTLSTPGRALLARNVSAALDRMFRGDVEVGAIGGSFITGLDIRRLVVRDTAGVLLADIPRLEVRYGLANILARRFVFARVHLVDPTIQLIKYRSGRMNYEEILRLGEGAGGGPSPLVDFRRFRIDRGDVTVRVPWNPPDSLTTQARRDSALAAERAKPGRVIEEGRDGLQRVIRLERLTVQFSPLTVSTPDHRPISAEIDTLATRVSDPGVELVQARGRIRTPHDSLIFEITRGALPHSRFTGAGAITWPDGPILFDFALQMSEVDLADLRWVSPDFPALHGRTDVTAKSESATRTAYDLQNLHLENDSTRVDGRVVALTDARRGLGVRGMDLAFRKLDLEAVRPYLDTLPLAGNLSGRLAGDGFFDDMVVRLAWDFADARVPGQPVSTLAGAGRVVMGGPEGFIFRGFELTSSDLDLETIRLVTPAMILEGRLALAGTLNGPWTNVTFRGSAVHQDGDRPPSRMVGMLRLDTRREDVAFEGDLRLDPLAFDGIRPAFPTLKSRGTLSGPVRLQGTLARLRLDADVAGELGALQVQGVAILLPPRWGGDSLGIDFQGLDLAALRGTGPTTALTGSALVNGVMDTLQPPEGTLDLRLGRGRLAEFVVDTVETRLSVHDNLLTIDTLGVDWRGGRASGRGTLGWARPGDGVMELEVRVDSLTAFDSLLTSALGLPPDTSAAPMPLAGRLRADLTLSGSLDSLDAAGLADLRHVAYRGYRLPSASATVGWVGGTRPQVNLELLADTLAIRESALSSLRADVQGRTDSLSWSGGFEGGGGVGIEAAGRYARHGDTRTFSFDELVARLTGHTWRLREPVTATLGDSSIAITPLRLEADDGSGAIALDGSLPGTGPGRLSVAVYGLELHDLYGLLQRDTTGVAGTVGADLEITGTRLAPVIQGTASLGDAIFGDFRAPFVQGVVRYQERRLDGNVSVWKTGKQVLGVELSLPLDLAFTKVARRQVDGPLAIRALADSLDLGSLEAFTTSVRRVGGTLRLDARVEGTWEQPRLVGFVDVADGRATLPSLGVRYSTIAGYARFAGDSLVLDSLLLVSDPAGGLLRATGTVRFTTLTNPVLDLNLNTNRFRATDMRAFLTLDATGQMRLSGQITKPLLTGRVTANSGVLYFADLLTKDVIDLEDPAYADLIDQRFLRMQRLGRTATARFLDSLQITGLTVQVGEAFWLRSHEANIQLNGQVRVDKIRRVYRVDGTLNAVRGTYTLKIGFVTRDFQVQRGRVRYLGTPDLNADLDIQAEHIVRPTDGSADVPVIAKITGSLNEPELALESDVLPPLSETNLVSYLMFGRPAAGLSSSGGAGDEMEALNAGLAYLGGALSSELERALVSDLGVPVDFIEIRPGARSALYGGTSSATEFAAGWQIGRRSFLTFSAGFCTEGQLAYNNVGASFEYRLSQQWRLKTSFEPTSSCQTSQTTNPLTNNERYQAGLDFLWDLEF